jgi:hypothetical protein
MYMGKFLVGNHKFQWKLHVYPIRFDIDRDARKCRRHDHFCAESYGEKVCHRDNRLN